MITSFTYQRLGSGRRSKYRCVQCINWIQHRFQYIRIIQPIPKQNDKIREQVTFTSEIVGSIPVVEPRHSREESLSTLYRKSWVFTEYSGFLLQGMLSGWVGISP